MSAGRFEIRRFALAGFMDMEAMFAGSQVICREMNSHAMFILCDSRLSHGMALTIGQIGHRFKQRGSFRRFSFVAWGSPGAVASSLGEHPASRRQQHEHGKRDKKRMVAFLLKAEFPSLFKQFIYLSRISGKEREGDSFGSDIFI